MSCADQMHLHQQSHQAWSPRAQRSPHAPAVQPRSRPVPLRDAEAVALRVGQRDVARHIGMLVLRVVLPVDPLRTRFDEAVDLLVEVPVTRDEIEVNTWELLRRAPADVHRDRSTRNPRWGFDDEPVVALVPRRPSDVPQCLEPELPSPDVVDHAERDLLDLGRAGRGSSCARQCSRAPNSA